MSGIADMLAEFHAALGDEPGHGGAALRVKLHDEEHSELVEELTELGPLGFRSPRSDGDVDRAKLARELADVVYLAFGTAHAFGIDLDVALAEIHRAAMSKLDPDCDMCHGEGTREEQVGEQDRLSGAWDTRTMPCNGCNGTGKGERVVREDGKILKPAGFVPPDMSEAVSA